MFGAGGAAIIRRWDGATAAATPTNAAHRDHAELQAAARRAALRRAAAAAAAAAAELRRGRGSGSGAGRLPVRGGAAAQPQSPAGLLPQRSQPDQREAAGKRQQVQDFF